MIAYLKQMFSRFEGGFCRQALRILGLLLIVVPSICRSADVVLIRGTRRHPIEEGQIRKVADFYGVNVRTVEIGPAGTVSRQLFQLRAPGTLAVLTSQDVLSDLNRIHTLNELRSAGPKGIPMLIFGVSAHESAEELKLWSGHAIKDCTTQAGGVRSKVLAVGRVRELSRTLAGWDLPAVSAPTCSMRFESGARIETVLGARGDSETNSVLVRARTGNAEVFFAPEMELFDDSWIGNPSALTQAVSSMAPFIFFLRYAAGDYGWHSDGQYANLTIDDPWLTQPYGRLDYPALLAEMEKHNFHTTLAFIPWNFDRSEADVAALFRGHPDRLSVCIHGDNHLHQEFGDYRQNSLRMQIEEIKQGVARMERFRVATGVPYDRFMVFPHGVAPEGTFAALKRYDFSGTANSLNVPLGTPFPVDPVFLLRSYTRDYANILSLFRYSANEISRLDIATQLFFGNPLLLYGHEDLFETGIGAFNGIADTINHARPGTQWASLGQIARHLYLVRRRSGREFDVQMLSNEMDLENSTDRDATFYIKRKEGSLLSIHSLKIGDAPARFEGYKNLLSLSVVIPAGQVRKIRIKYQNDLELPSQNIRKTGFHETAIRRVSDFRDLYLSRLFWGRLITQTYYRHGWNRIEVSLERRWLAVTMFLGLVFAGLWYRHQQRTRACAK